MLVTRRSNMLKIILFTVAWASAIALLVLLIIQIFSFENAQDACHKSCQEQGFSDGFLGARDLGSFLLGGDKCLCGDLIEINRELPK